MVRRGFRVFAGLVLVFFVLVALLLMRPDLTRDDLAHYAAAPSRFLALPDGALAHYREQGNPEGPVLVLVHGSNASLHTWEPWAADLGAQYRVISVDMPGHGLTGRTPADDYSRAGMVSFLHTFASEMGLKDFVLAGNSMGGGISLLYALEHPENVRALVLVSSGGLAPTGEREMPLAFRLAGLPVLNHLLQYLSHRGLTEEGLKSVIQDDTLVTEAMIDRYTDLNRHQGNRRAMLRRFSGADPSTDLSGRLAEIEVPTLILWGAQDYLIPVSAGEKLHAGLNNSTLIVYDDVGHIAMEEIPAKSAQDVRAFLTSLALPAPGRFVDGEEETRPEPE